MINLTEAVKNIDKKLTSDQQKQVEKCEDSYNTMKQMGLAGKQDFNGDTSPIADYSRTNKCTFSYFW